MVLSHKTMVVEKNSYKDFMGCASSDEDVSQNKSGKGNQIIGPCQYLKSLDVKPPNRFFLVTQTAFLLLKS